MSSPFERIGKMPVYKILPYIITNTNYTNAKYLGRYAFDAYFKKVALPHPGTHFWFMYGGLAASCFLISYGKRKATEPPQYTMF